MSLHFPSRRFRRPSISVSTSSASWSRFLLCHPAGLSGMNSRPMTESGTGAALEASIHRQCPPNDKKIGDDHRARSADDDRQLVDRHQSAADARRRHLGDEHRRTTEARPTPTPPRKRKRLKLEDAAAHSRVPMAPAQRAGRPRSASASAPTVAQRIRPEAGRPCSPPGAAHGQPHLMRRQRRNPGLMKTIAPEMIDRS